MSKISIVTYYNANNYGAFLQAYSLMKFLQEHGHEVIFKGMSIKPQISDNAYSYELNEKLNIAQKELPIDWGGGNCKCDVSIIGSDEVFNFNNTTYGDISDFDGSGLLSDKVISYAASIGATNYVKLVLRKFSRCLRLRRFDAMGVRDKRTERFVKLFYHKKISRNVDPTLLVNLDTELIKPNFDKYILVYTYGMRSEHIDFIKEFAQEHRLKIITSGSFCDWNETSEVVLPTPFEWIGLIKYADFVFTSTFHGTIFAIKYKKQFLALVNESKKVEELLYDFGLQERYCRTTDRNVLKSILSDEIDYSTVKIEKMIDHSSAYLLKALNGDKSSD